MASKLPLTISAPFTLSVPITLSLSKGDQLRASTSSARTILFLFAFLMALPANAAMVTGQVKLDGPVPAPEKVAIEEKKGGNHSTEGCGSLVKDSPKLIVGPEGGIKNAVVWFNEEDLTPVEKAEPVLIDQNQCVFEPHVVALPVGGRIAVRNSDSVIHNIRIFREGKPDMLMHQWQKAGPKEIPWQFNEPGRYVVRCGVHHWMYSWVVVLAGKQAAVTDAQGNFSLELPEGAQQLHVWHETLGTDTIRVVSGNPEPVLISLKRKE